MVGSNNNIISGNTFSKGVIRAWHHCNHNEISYNTLDSSTKGIIIFFSYYNTLTHNVINGAKDAAIIVSMSAHDDISYNTIRNCNSGLTLYAHDCNITYNNFIGVLKEAKIDSNDNFWVHNYWGRPRFLPKLIITASVFVTGSTTTDTFYGSLSPTLEIPLNVNLIDIQTPLTQSQSDKIEKTKTITLKTSNQQLIIYIITTVLSSILLALFLVLTKNKTQTTDELAKTVKKIRKKYGEWIVDIDNLPSSIDKQVLTVKTLDDLVKISEELGKPVMHYTSVTPNPGERHIFYVIDEDTHYKYVLTNE